MYMKIIHMCIIFHFYVYLHTFHTIYTHLNNLFVVVLMKIVLYK